MPAKFFIPLELQLQIIILYCTNIKYPLLLYPIFLYQNIVKFNDISQNFNVTNTSLTTPIINKSSKIYSSDKILKDFDIEI